MVTTALPPRTRVGATNGQPPARMRLSPAKPRRNGVLIAVGVLLIVGCGLIAAVLQMRATSKTEVLAVSHQVPAGQQVRSSDLSTVAIAGGGGLRAIRAADEATVIGATASVPLMPGTLVTREQLAKNSAVTKGKVVIGLSLKPGQVPTSHLKEGDQVLVVATGSAAQLAGDTSSAGAGPDRPAGAVLVQHATVFGIDDASRNNDNTSVSVVVDEADAPAVAAAASVSQITLVLQSTP